MSIESRLMSQMSDEIWCPIAYDYPVLSVANNAIDFTPSCKSHNRRLIRNKPRLFSPSRHGRPATESELFECQTKATTLNITVLFSNFTLSLRSHPELKDVKKSAQPRCRPCSSESADNQDLIEARRQQELC